MQQTITRYLERICRILILLLLLLVPLIYPLQIRDQWMAQLEAFFIQHNLSQFWAEQLVPFLYLGYAPLTLKGSIASVLIISLVVCYFLLKILQRNEPRRTGVRHWILLMFLLYGAISLFYTPTFYYSLRTYTNVILFVLFFLIVSDMAKTRKFVMQAVGILFFTAFCLGVVALLQHLELSRSFLHEFPNVRNRMGSFIGHNTGLSCFLMPSFFVAIALFLVTKRPWHKIVLGIFLVFLIAVFLTAQSKGVWLVLLFVTPVYLYHLTRVAQVRLPIRTILISTIIILLLMLSQVISSRYNPFKSPEAPILTRLSHFNPAVIKKGTRFRILVCSMPLISQSPIWGHGIGSFQYVYPKAQGAYLTEHHETLLWPTPKRTLRAHNDYIQIAIELGIVGLLLVLIGLYHYLKFGWTVLECSSDPWERGIQCGIFIALAATILHAFLDFPMHIAPIALQFAFLFGIWISGDRLWRLAPEAHQIASPSQSAPDTPQAPAPNGTRIPRLGRVGLLAFALILIGVSPLANHFILINYVTDIYRARAEGYVQNFLTVPDATREQKFLWLRSAEALIRKAMSRDRLNGYLSFSGGEIAYMIGSTLAKTLNDPSIGDDPDGVNFYKAKAHLYLNRGIDRLEASLREIRFHAVFYLLGLSYYELSKLSPDDDYLREAKENLQTAIWYSPAYTPALDRLAEIYIKQRVPNPMLIRSLHRKIAKYDPQFYEDHYVGKAFRELYNGQYEKAVETFQSLIQITPERQDLYLHLATTYLFMNRIPEAEQILREQKRLRPNSTEVDSQLVTLYLKKGDFQSAYEYTRRVLERTKDGNDYYEVIEALCLERLGQITDAQQKLTTILEKAKAKPVYLYNLGYILVEFFNDPERGIHFLEQRVALPIPTNPKAYQMIAEYYFKQGDLEKAEHYNNLLLQAFPGFEAAKKLQDEIQQRRDATPSKQEE